jgi:hypothetical protein
MAVLHTDAADPGRSTPAASEASYDQPMAYLPILLWNLATLVPIWLGWWDVFAVLGLYWFENACTGVFQYLRIRDCEHAQPQRSIDFGTSGFFAMHYGIFTAVHGILVLVFFGLVMGGLWQQGRYWWLSAVTIAAVHYVDYRAVWTVARGWTRTTPGRLMAEPYARVMILHVVVIVGGYVALSTQDPQLVLLLFAAFKLAMELLAKFLWSGFMMQTKD